MDVEESTYEEVRRETLVKGEYIVDELDVLIAQVNTQCLDVRLHVLDLPRSDDGEDVRCLMHHVGDCNCDDGHDEIQERR